MSSPVHTDIQNTMVRMVVPMRREFGCALDVQQMRSDRAYAESIVAQAMTSRVESLRDCARRVAEHLSATQAPRRRATERSAVPAPDSAQRRAALAARRLIDLVGPIGEALAIRIERAADEQALDKAIGDARACIAGLRGEAAADDYGHHLARGSAGPDAGACADAPAQRVGSASVRRSASGAARELLALVGPLGHDLAERIEGAADTQALMALIDEARAGIASVIGSDAANEYVHRIR